MRCEGCCAAIGPGLAPPRFLRRWGGSTHLGSVIVANFPTFDRMGLSHVFLHVFALFRPIEEATTCVWGSLATRIVAQVPPFFPPFPLFSSERQPL